MKAVGTGIDGVELIETPRHRDDRGYFSRTFDREWLAAAGTAFDVQQTAISQNARRGTIRGMHWQDAPEHDPKIVRCIKGRMFDVVVDIRRNSPTFLKWQGFELSADGDQSLLIPGGLAHGFQTLTDETELLYLIGAPYRQELSRGIRWNDPVLAIAWPLAVSVISERDRNLPEAMACLAS